MYFFGQNDFNARSASQDATYRSGNLNSDTKKQSEHMYLKYRHKNVKFSIQIYTYINTSLP